MDSIQTLQAKEVAKYYNDPLGYVLWAFPWGAGELEGREGPDVWQRELLSRVKVEVDADPFDGINKTSPRQFAVTSGHGVGKSALTAWITLWLMSTRPMSKGVITANTRAQLSNRTWAELKKWKNLCIIGDWFHYYNSSSQMALRHVDYPVEWKVDGVPFQKDNSEGFAGLHNAGSSPWYIFDEASAIPHEIWVVANGGKTDGEPFHFVFGNPTRSTGDFYDCFTKNKHRWNTYKVDSRKSMMTNHELIAEWAEDWGEDSDDFKVRVKGEFPSSSDLQLISTLSVDESAKREVFVFPDEPLICGIDVARGGDDFGVIQFRKGNDARSYKKYMFPGALIADTTRFISKIVDVCNELHPEIINVDNGAMGGPVKDRLCELGFKAYDVGFGNRAIRTGKYANKSAEMWYNMKVWLLSGGCIKPNDYELREELTSREFTHDNKDRILLEKKDLMKKRMGRSPDSADALGLTFATPYRKANFDKMKSVSKKARVRTYNKYRSK